MQNNLKWRTHFIKLQTHSSAAGGMCNTRIALEELHRGTNFDDDRGTLGERVWHRQVTSVNPEFPDTSLSHDSREFDLSGGGEGRLFCTARFLNHGSRTKAYISSGIPKMVSPC